MIGKLHNNIGNKVFACCDKELINTIIKHKELEVNISSSFFGSDILTEEEIINFINECDSANIFGKKICDLLLSKNIIINKQIILINKIPHTQIYKL